MTIRARAYQHAITFLTITLLLDTTGFAQASLQTDGDRPPRRVPGTPAELPAPFSVIRAVMALPDGRLVVSDPEENRVLLIDFAKGTSRELARTGAGPREYRRAGGLYRARGGGVLIFDQGLRRLLPVTATGELQDVVALPIPGSSSSHSNRGPDPYAPDSLGDGYGAYRFGRDPTAPTFPFVRYRHDAGGRADTVARLLKPLSKVLEATGNAFRSVEIFFSPQDAWAVAPDGRVAVVRAAPYRVEWIPLDGPTVTGPVITNAPIKVTQADKDATTARVGRLGGKQNVNMGVGPEGGRPPPGSCCSPTSRRRCGSTSAIGRCSMNRAACGWNGTFRPGRRPRCGTCSTEAATSPTGSRSLWAPA